MSVAVANLDAGFGRRRVLNDVSLTVEPGRRPYFGWRPHADDLDAAAHAIRMVDLDRFAHRPMDELSGGERQRVAIARAIAQQPAALVLDEPTTYLDLHHQLLALETVTDLARTRDTAIVMTMHDLNLAVRFSDVIVVLSHGNIAAAGSPDVLDQALLREVYDVECTITTVDDHPDRPCPSTRALKVVRSTGRVYVCRPFGRQRCSRIAGRSCSDRTTVTPGMGPRGVLRREDTGHRHAPIETPAVGPAAPSADVRRHP